MKTDAEIANNTAAYVVCDGGLVDGDPGCGLQPLTATEYEAQLSQPHRTWRCPRCGNSAEYNDTESERVQGVNDEVRRDDLPPGERERILGRLTAALDAPLPEGLVNKVKAVHAECGGALEKFGLEVLTLAGLFVDDMMVDHNDLDPAALRRVAANALIKNAVLIIDSAKRMEGDKFDPAKFAIVVFGQYEDWERHRLNQANNLEIVDHFVPGALRSELEADGVVARRQQKQHDVSS